MVNVADSTDVDVRNLQKTHTKEKKEKEGKKEKADTQSRTGDLTLTKGALYQLSHISTFGAGSGNRTRIISLEG